MKCNYLFCFCASLSMLLSSCNIDEIYDGIMDGDGNLPEGALPSAEFSPNNLSNEPFAEDAIRIEAEGTQNSTPFHSLELMPDGHYLLTTTSDSYNSYASPVCVKTKADGSFSICRNRQSKAVCTRSTTDENGTLYLDNGIEYGTFEKLEDKKYRLSNGAQLDLCDVLDADKKISYTDRYGRISNVYVNVTESVSGVGTKSICRTWKMNSIDLWLYMGGMCLASAKQSIKNGKAETVISTMMGGGEDVSEFLDEDSNMCCEMVFTSAGTYICSYLNGDVAVARWYWVDEEKGVLYYSWDLEGMTDGHVSVRFSGKQMRIYEDYTDTEEENMRIVLVNTLTAANS